MKRMTQVAAVAVALAVTGGARLEAQTAPAQAPWLHVRVEEQSKASKVAVNLPLSVVEAALALAPEKVISHGQIHLPDAEHSLKIADMRKLWKELRAAGDAEIVSVQQKDETVSVRRQGDRLRCCVARSPTVAGAKADRHGYPPLGGRVRPRGT